MCENVNIKFRHALYDFQGHHSGVKLGRDDAMEQAISELINGADMALYRNEGYFFDTVGEQMFVFGRLVEWNSVRSGECFFDLYATSVKDLHNVSVTDVVEVLLNQSQRVSEKSQSIESSVNITVQRENASAEDRNAQRGPNVTTNNTDRTDEKPKSPSAASDEYLNAHPMSGEDVGLSDTELRFIAQFWEQYRRGTDPVNASVDSVDKMASLVDGTLSNIRFVSRVEDQGDPYHFDVVGEGSGTAYDVAALVDTVREIDDNDSLAWNKLPTYEEELDDLIASRRERLRPAFETAANEDEFVVSFETFCGRFDSDQTDRIDESRLKFYHGLWNSVVNEYWETLTTFEAIVQRRAADTLTEAVGPNTEFVDEREESEGLINKMSGLVSGRDERNAGSKVWDIDVDHVDDEEIQEVMHQVGEQALEKAYERLDDGVSDDLQKRLKRRARSISLETVRQLDAIRDSRAYRETYHGTPPSDVG